MKSIKEAANEYSRGGSRNCDFSSPSEEDLKSAARCGFLRGAQFERERILDLFRSGDYQTHCAAAVRGEVEPLAASVWLEKRLREIDSE